MNIYITFIKQFAFLTRRCWTNQTCFHWGFCGGSTFLFLPKRWFFPWNPPWNPPCFHVFSTCFLWWISVNISQNVNKHEIFHVKKQTCEFPMWFSQFFSPHSNEPQPVSPPAPRWSPATRAPRRTIPGLVPFRRTPMHRFSVKITYSNYYSNLYNNFFNYFVNLWNRYC